MLKPDDVPIKVIEELRRRTRCGCDKCLSKAIAAAINAWPGAYRMGDDIDRARLCLPVPTEEQE